MAFLSFISPSKLHINNIFYWCEINHNNNDGDDDDNGDDNDDSDLMSLYQNSFLYLLYS
jgi:hypothetical protein